MRDGPFRVIKSSPSRVFARTYMHTCTSRMRFWNLNGNNGILGFFVNKILPLRLAPAKSRMYGDAAHISVHVMKMFSGDRILFLSTPKIVRNINGVGVNELCNRHSEQYPRS